MGKGVTKIIFSKLIGIMIFLIILGALNFLIKYLPFESLISFTNFFNRHALLLIGIGIVFMFGELLSLTGFPSNIFSPILNFVGAWMTLYFSFIFLEAIQRRFSFSFLETIFLVKEPIFITILSLTFIFGYLPIIYKLLKEKRQTEGSEDNPVIIEKVKVVPKIVEKIVFKEKKSPELKKKRNKKKKR